MDVDKCFFYYGWAVCSEEGSWFRRGHLLIDASSSGKYKNKEMVI